MKKISLIICIAAVFLLGGCTLNAQAPPVVELSDTMRDLYELRLEYCQEKYGDEFTLDLGTVYSTRFPGVEVQLFYNGDTRSFQDKYLVYLREAELSQLLKPIVESVYGECKIFILPYGYCSAESTTRTTAEELLRINEEGRPPVQLRIYTDKDRGQNTDDLQALAEALQAKQYSLYVNIIYVTTENMALAEEAQQSSNMRRSKEFFLVMGDALITPEKVKRICISIWTSGIPDPDTQELGDRIAESMRSPYRAKLKYFQDRYGDEFIQDDYTGAIYSTRFPGQSIQCFWDRTAQSYRDIYLGYLQKAELSALLTPLAEGVYGSCKTFITPYGESPVETTQFTTAEELLGLNWDGTPMAQLTIYTVKDPITKDDDLKKLVDAIQSKQYWVAVNVLYVTPDNLELVVEAEHEQVHRDALFTWMANVIVAPDGFRWKFSERWMEGE